MLNRRHLRIKVLQMLYAYYQSEEKDWLKADKELTLSVERLYDMYLFLLLAFEPLVRAAENKIEDRRKKLRPSQEDLNPNLRFVSNPVMEKIIGSESLNAIASKRKVNWSGAENQEIFRKLFLNVLSSENYALYMMDGTNDWEQDRKYVLQLFKDEIANSPFLYHFFEDRSIYWMDDLDLCCSMVLKSIKSMEQGKAFEPLPLFKDQDDESTFIHDLLKKTIEHNDEHEALIERLTDNWEMDRIAKMDLLFLKMGLSEFLFFPSIPTKVTINEYIEISKFYSTPKSNIFINGILDKMVVELKQNKRLLKTGRGLMD
ncbi:MAG: transcription antitermination factor NusB [Flavobacteriales bacterium]